MSEIPPTDAYTATCLFQSSRQGSNSKVRRNGHRYTSPVTPTLRLRRRKHSQRDWALWNSKNCVRISRMCSPSRCRHGPSHHTGVIYHPSSSVHHTLARDDLLRLIRRGGVMLFAALLLPLPRQETPPHTASPSSYPSERPPYIESSRAEELTGISPAMPRKTRPTSTSQLAAAAGY